MKRSINPELNRACIAVGKLANSHEKLRRLLREDQPWPLRDVLAKLHEATGILLHKKNYDGDGWEQIQQAHQNAKDILHNCPKTK